MALQKCLIFICISYQSNTYQKKEYYRKLGGLVYCKVGVHYLMLLLTIIHFTIDHICSTAQMAICFYKPYMNIYTYEWWYIHMYCCCKDYCIYRWRLFILFSILYYILIFCVRNVCANNFMFSLKNTFYYIKVR